MLFISQNAIWNKLYLSGSSFLRSVSKSAPFSDFAPQADKYAGNLILLIFFCDVQGALPFVILSLTSALSLSARITEIFSSFDEWTINDLIINYIIIFK